MSDGEAAVRRRRPRLGLIGRIGLGLALVGFVPLLLVAAQLARVNREALLEQLLRTHGVAARTAAEATEAFLAPRRALARALVADPRIAADAAGPEAQAALRDHLASWSEVGVDGIVVLDGAGGVVVRAQRRGAGERVEKWAAARSSAPAELAQEEGVRWALLSEPRPGGGEIRLLARAEPLDRALAPDELGEQARLLLVARDGTTLVGGAQELAALPAAARAAALSARLSGAGRYDEGSGAEERVVAWSPVGDGSWLVVSTQPAAIAEAAARRMARRAAVAVGLAAALVGALSLAAWRSIVRPIRALLAAQRRAEGRAPAATADTEVEQMASALAALERHAKDRDALGDVFLGRYQVVEMIGSGGMGTVFRGWDPRLQRPVALKTIHLAPKPGTASVGAAGLLAEAVAAAQIADPHVVAIYDAEEIRDMAFVAMEFVDGVGLDRYLEERQVLEWQEVAPLGLAMARGLAAAHARGVVHRDVKPGNVLLGNDGSIKIADFGLAQFLGARTAEPGRVFGTPGFLAPEALLGKPYEAASDLFALGVVLYRATIGRYPFVGASFREVVVATVRGPSASVEDFGGVAPDDFARIVCALLEKDPRDRLAPGPRVVEALAECVARHGVEWRLDFRRAGRPLDAEALFRSANLPTIELPAGER
jgi:serine/threonine-protein kinase